MFVSARRMLACGGFWQFTAFQSRNGPGRNDRVPGSHRRRTQGGVPGNPPRRPREEAECQVEPSSSTPTFSCGRSREGACARSSRRSPGKCDFLVPEGAYAEAEGSGNSREGSQCRFASHSKQSAPSAPANIPPSTPIGDTVSTVFFLLRWNRRRSPRDSAAPARGRRLSGIRPKATAGLLPSPANPVNHHTITRSGHSRHRLCVHRPQGPNSCGWIVRGNPYRD